MATKTKASKVRVSERALMARINRQLTKDQKKLCKATGVFQREFGDFYIIDGNTIVMSIRNAKGLESYARDDLGVLKAWEALSSGT